MKNLSKGYLLIVAILLVSFAAQAQNYNTAIGVRLGGLTNGVTIKHFVASRTALEGIVSFGQKSFLVTGLYEKHRSIDNAAGLTWLYGVGAHVGFFNYGGGYYYVKNNRTYVLREGDNRTVVGADFILGLDYKFPNVPFNVGLDIKPFVDFFDGPKGFFDGAVSLRFAF